MINKRIKKIFSAVFGTDSVGLDTSINDIDRWDSFGHVELIVAIEKEFSIQFSFSEIIELNSVKKIQEHLEKRGVFGVRGNGNKDGNRLS